jgi:hypothetical protein
MAHPGDFEDSLQFQPPLEPGDDHPGEQFRSGPVACVLGQLAAGQPEGGMADRDDVTFVQLLLADPGAVDVCAAVAVQVDDRVAAGRLGEDVDEDSSAGLTCWSDGIANSLVH